MVGKLRNVVIESCPIGASTRTRVGAPVVPGRRRVLVVLLAVLMGALLTGCRLDVRVDTVVEEDGSGEVTVAVGLDDAARGRVGDPAETFHVEDLRAAGWTVTFAERDPDGMTWVQATKPFATPEEAATVLAEVTGVDGPLRDVRVTREASITSTDWTFDATVDLTGGPEAFSDPEVAAALGGDALGGNVAEIEAAEGMPVAEMVDVTVTVDLPAAEAETWHPSFADPTPTAISAQSSELLPAKFLGGEDGPGLLGIGLIGGMVLAAVLVGVVLWRRAVGRR